MSHPLAKPVASCSVIVCTYNRADSLSLTLDALRAQVFPTPVDWEVLVVDNNSRDHTPAVVAQCQREWPRLRYVHEPRQGLSHARNLGIAHASGDILLFTDDDVIPENNWVHATVTGLQKHDADACGGPIAPIWEAPPPHWLTPRFHGFLAIKSGPAEDFEIKSADDLPFGANMALRRGVFGATGVFDISRGRVGQVLSSGEDGELFTRVLAARFKVVFLADARVHHRIEAHRATRRYLRRWRYETSRNLALTYSFQGARLLGIPRFMFRQLLRAVWRAAVAGLTCNPDEAFNRQLIVAHFIGLSSGLFRLWLTGSTDFDRDANRP
jgi:glycosyltransferase involved in cell wall biosynthesis